MKHKTINSLNSAIINEIRYGCTAEKLEVVLKSALKNLETIKKQQILESKSKNFKSSVIKYNKSSDNPVVLLNSQKLSDLKKLVGDQISSVMELTSEGRLVYLDKFSDVVFYFDIEKGKSFVNKENKENWELSPFSKLAEYDYL